MNISGASPARYSGIQMSILLMLLLILLAAMTTALPRGAHAASPYTYEGAGIVVSQDGQGNTRVDNGSVVCDVGSNDTGVGGFCIPYADMAASGSTLTVTDELVGHGVSYQVCLDNNGNNICGDGSGACADQLLFSHSGAAFANPMSGLPTAPAAGCPGSNGFEGLVVLICRGTHDTHVENASSGTGALSSGSGTAGFTEPGPPVPFCGGAPVNFGKIYAATSSGAPSTPISNPLVLAAGTAGLLAAGSVLARKRHQIAEV